MLRRRQVRAWIAILIVLLVAMGSLSLGWYLGKPPPTSPPPSESLGVVSYALVSQGNLSLHLPLMTAYTPDNRSFPGAHGTTSMWFVSSATNTAVAFDWVEAAGPNLPVRFVWRDADLHGVNGSLARFVISPNNCATCSSQSTGWNLNESNWSAVMVVDLEIQYTVLRTTLRLPRVSVSWLQVNYSITDQQELGLRLPSPYAESVYNATLPSPSDLAPVGGSFPLSLRPQTSMSFDVSRVLPGSAVYHNALPPVTLDGGPFGPIHTRLVSAFSWAEPNEYSMKVYGGDVPVTLGMYVDLRFGSLYLVFLP